MTYPGKALITGASSGIGEALARQMASRGVEVWLAARRKSQLDALVAEIRAAGGTAHSLALDVSNHDETRDRLVELDASVGGIDMVIANAGFAGAKAAVHITECTHEDAMGILSVNAMGAVATLLPFVGPMLARGRGHLVGVTSLTVDGANPRTASYGASKAALRYFLHSCDIALRPRGVAVSEIVPGFVRTPAAETIDEPMPMVWEMDRAARHIDTKLRKRKKLIRFPWPLHFAARMISRLPRPIYDWLAPYVWKSPDKRGRSR